MVYIFIVALVAVALAYLEAKRSANRAKTGKEKPAYKYRKKSFLMTKAEHAFFTQLQNNLGGQYFIFPQVHLSAFLDHTVPGQDWRAALSTIQRKSVDYIVCDKVYVRPLVAIELDDRTHSREDRLKRDGLVEAICAQAGMPLVRFATNTVSDAEITQALSAYLQ